MYEGETNNYPKIMLSDDTHLDEPATQTKRTEADFPDGLDGPHGETKVGWAACAEGFKIRRPSQKVSAAC